MDYKECAENFEQIACVVSMDPLINGDYGDIRIEYGNQAYRDYVDNLGDFYVPGGLYTDYIPKDMNFENLVYKCITEKRPLHSYINAVGLDAWMDINVLPLKSDDDKLGYCLFSFELTPDVDVDKLADISGDTASHVLKTCLKLRETDDFKVAMTSIVRDIGLLCDSSHCCILLTDFKKRVCSVLSEYIREGSGLLPMNTYLGPDFFDIVATWPDTVGGSNCCVVSDDRDMRELSKRNPEWTASLMSAGAESVVLYPLKGNGQTLGYMWAINFDVERTQVIKEILEVTTFILSSEIASHQLYEHMELTSRYDLLTSVMNRNAMNIRIDRIVLGEDTLIGTYGVVFAGIKGLRTLNDNIGHHAGDELIKRAADTLSKIFEGYEVYRAGGDEFLVFCDGISKNYFDKLTKTLRDNYKVDGGVNFAVGSCYGEDGENLRKALKSADEQMYSDMEEFYRKHPGQERRGLLF
ncbi:MAG: GGDEF domain-containing protein [Lachnospiraceae bacterium]|jgi:diguanylate cyclase (GGDEF)-like protein|nr:GGDEF domain-containing protein [Lachnospiraceae bacterium]